MTSFRLARVYTEPTSSDGTRVLADRLWPRGLSKEKARIDLWLKDLTPSNGLRIWYHTHPEDFDEFSARYRQELEAQPQAIEQLLGAGEFVTLLTARKELEHSHLVVLLEVLERS
ncbi:MAG: DUF488 family protein [Aeromicrobium sp.]